MIHKYSASIEWTGNLGEGTADYKSYARDYSVMIEGKLEIQGSSDALFRGDKSKHNPEDLLLASLSSCHMLWYLHLCADNKITVISYIDNAIGYMETEANGSGRFKEIILNPVIKIIEKDKATLANELHKEANKMCFIANSVNFEVKHCPVIEIIEG